MTWCASTTADRSGHKLCFPVMKELYDILGIKKLQMTAYHPESNGAVERLNQMLVDTLPHFVAHDQRDWDQWLHFAMFAYNTPVHEGTNETPFFLLHGRVASTSSVEYEVDEIHYNTMEDYRAELAQRLLIPQRHVAKALIKTAEKRRARSDLNGQPSCFEVGDKVFVRVNSGHPY